MKNPCDGCLVQPMCIDMCGKAKTYYTRNVVKPNPDYRERRRDDQYVEVWTTTSNVRHLIEKPIDGFDREEYLRKRKEEDERKKNKKNKVQAKTETTIINEIKETEQCQIMQPHKKSNTLKDSTSAFSRLTELKTLLKGILKTPLAHGKKAMK